MSLYAVEYDLETDSVFVEAVALQWSAQQTLNKIMDSGKLYGESLSIFGSGTFAIVLKSICTFMSKLVIVLKKVLVFVFVTVFSALAKRFADSKRSGGGSSGGGGGGTYVGVPAVTSQSLQDHILKIKKVRRTADVDKMRKYLKTTQNPRILTAREIQAEGHGPITDSEALDAVLSLIDSNIDEINGLGNMIRSNVEPMDYIAFVVDEPSVMDIIIASINTDIKENSPSAKELHKAFASFPYQILTEKGFKELANCMRLCNRSATSHKDIANFIIKACKGTLDAYSAIELNLEYIMNMITDNGQVSISSDMNTFFNRLKSSSIPDKMGSMKRLDKSLRHLESSGSFTYEKAFKYIFEEELVCLEKANIGYNFIDIKDVRDGINRTNVLSSSTSKILGEFKRIDKLSEMNISYEDLTNTPSNTVVRVKLIPKVNPNNYIDGELLAYHTSYGIYNSAKEMYDIGEKSKGMESRMKSFTDNINKMDLKFPNENNVMDCIQDNIIFNNNMLNILSNIAMITSNMCKPKMAPISAYLKEFIIERANVLAVSHLQNLIQK